MHMCECRTTRITMYAARPESIYMHTSVTETHQSPKWVGGTEYRCLS